MLVGHHNPPYYEIYDPKPDAWPFKKKINRGPTRSPTIMEVDGMTPGKTLKSECQAEDELHFRVCLDRNALHLLRPFTIFPGVCTSLAVVDSVDSDLFRCIVSTVSTGRPSIGTGMTGDATPERPPWHHPYGSAYLLRYGDWRHCYAGARRVQSYLLRWSADP